MAEPAPESPPAPAATVEDWTPRFEAEELRRARRGAGLLLHQDGTPRKPDDAARRIAEERRRCRQDILHWIGHYAWVPLQKAAPGEHRRAPLMLWPRQKQLVLWIVQSIQEGRDGVVNKGREVGATWLVLDVFLWHWLFDRGFLAKLFSRKEAYVDDRTLDSLFGMLRWQLALQPGWLRPREVSDTHLHLLNLETRSEITGEATTANAGRGGRRTAVLFDELARVDDSVQGPAWLSLETVARARFAVSTPNGRGNHFHTLWTTFPAERRLQLDWPTDPRRSEAWYQGLLLENGGQLTWDEREQEHACSFGGVSGLRVLRADAETVLYDDDTPEWAEVAADARKRWPQLGVMDFGSGPSWTVYTLFLLHWRGEEDPIPDAWVDLCLAWQGEAVDSIAADIQEALGEYGSPRRWLYGDPAGANRESDQESWISNLNRCGVRVAPLEPWFNSPYGVRKTLEDFQQLLTAGRLRVHRHRAALFWDAIEGWQYKAPEGVPVQLLELSRLKPRKDRHSHPGDTGRYGAGAILRMVRRPKPRTDGGPIRRLRLSERRVPLAARVRHLPNPGRPMPGRY